MFDTDLTVTLTSTAMTSTMPVTDMVTFCSNGGVLVSDKCHCPSGYAGTLCEQKIGTDDVDDANVFTAPARFVQFQIKMSANESFAKTAEIASLGILMDPTNQLVSVDLGPWDRTVK